MAISPPPQFEVNCQAVWVILDRYRLLPLARFQHASSHAFAMPEPSCHALPLRFHVSLLAIHPAASFTQEQMCILAPRVHVQHGIMAYAGRLPFAFLAQRYGRSMAPEIIGTCVQSFPGVYPSATQPAWPANLYRCGATMMPRYRNRRPGPPVLPPTTVC